MTTEFYFLAFNTLIVLGYWLFDGHASDFMRALWMTIVVVSVPTANLCYWTATIGPGVGFAVFVVIVIIYGLAFHRWL